MIPRLECHDNKLDKMMGFRSKFNENPERGGGSPESPHLECEMMHQF